MRLLEAPLQKAHLVLRERHPRTTAIFAFLLSPDPCKKIRALWEMKWETYRRLYVDFLKWLSSTISFFVSLLPLYCTTSTILISHCDQGRINRRTVRAKHGLTIKELHCSWHVFIALIVTPFINPGLLSYLHRAKIYEFRY